MDSIRVFVNARLAAAANEICRVFESTIAEYQEEVCRSKQEIEQLRSVRKAVVKIQLKRTDSQQLSSSAEIVPEHQQETPGLDREHPELKLKEENEELCISQRKELLIPTRELETPYTESCCDQDKDNSSHVGADVKYRETDEPLPSSSTVSQLKTEPGEEDCKLTEVTEPISGNLLSSAAQSEHITLTTLTAEKEQSVKKKKRTMLNKSNLNPPSQDTQSSYCCKVCGQIFNVRGYLFRHAQTHTHSCAVCGESFESGTSLKDHLPVHIRDLNKCNVCNKSFSNVNAKNIHMRIHTGEKRYSCTFCGRKFIHYSSMVCHKRMHTGEKPYSCRGCRKCFIDGSGLKKHKCREKRHGSRICGTTHLENQDSVQAGQSHDSVQPRENLVHCSVCKEQETPGLDREHPELKEELKDENEELCISQRKVLLIPTRELETPYTESCCDQGKDNSSHVGADVKYRETDEPLPSSSTVSQIKTEPGEEDCKLTEVTEPISGNLLSSAAQSEHITLTTLTAEKEQSVKKNKMGMLKKSNLNPPSQDTQSSYCCKVCGQIFNVRGFLFRHAQTHTHACAVCGESFESGTSLKDHFPVHITDLNVCNVCNKSFSNVNAKNIHMRIHTGEKRYICTFCGRKFIHYSSMVLHKRMHTGERPYSCHGCGKFFIDGSGLKKHKCREKRHGSQICGTTHLENQDSVQAGQSHDSVQPRENLVHCSVCNYGVNTSAEMEVHMQKHQTGRWHGCHVCGKVYTRAHPLKVHFRVHTGHKPYPCSECGKGFNCNSAMKMHLRIHTGERPFSCTYCGMKFKQNGGLKRHKCREKRQRSRICGTTHLENQDSVQAGQSHDTVQEGQNHDSVQPGQSHDSGQAGQSHDSGQAGQSHDTVQEGQNHDSVQPGQNHDSVQPGQSHDTVQEGQSHDSVQPGQSHDSGQAGQSHDSVQPRENLVHCSVCNYGVNTSAEMEVHMEQHLTGKHSCHVCGKVYTTRQHLKVHFRVHTGNKPYSCSECGKCFKTNSEMKMHLRIHTGERPFSCTYCNMRFKQSAHLVWHMKGHTGEKPYSCSFCGKCFKTATERNRHMEVMKKHTSHRVETVSF